MKIPRKLIILFASLLVALGAWVLIFSDGTPRAEAQKTLGCNTANVAGKYAYAGFGTIHPGNPAGYPPGLYNTVATLYMDGMGNYTVTAKTSYNGMIVPEEFAGTYEVGDTCDVTFYYNGFPSVFAYFTNNRSETRAMSTIPGTNITMLTVRK